LAVITPKKLRQMRFAAMMYVHANRLTKANLQLAAVAMTGVPPQVVDYIEIV
jgi:hypothetical protein